MKKIVGALVAGALSLGTAVWGGEWIRVNQLGYLPASPKVAVYMSDEAIDLESYALVDDCTGQEVMRFDTPRAAGLWGRMQRMYRLDFTACNRPGTYRLRAGDALSPRFVIGNRVYDGTADFILRYMRQQRCGFNPFERDSCHTHDGYIVYHPTRSGQHIDVRGGWHDASDQLQYVTTSANATYQMMFAYLKNPGAYGDAYDANGLPGTNGIPDIVDEIKWGLDWLNRMNPSKGEMYNQIADDRDHKGFKLPSQDEIDYGWGKGLGRPVYYCSGEPQVRGEFTNATTGVASTAGKYASCFALGARVLADFYPAMADTLLAKARDAYRHGVEHPGVCQTASVVSPYIYEECNWTDDMELAAAQLYFSTGEPQFLNEAVEYGRFEPVTPWMGADSARHYQWYPFINLGHYHLAGVDDSRVSRDVTTYNGMPIVRVPKNRFNTAIALQDGYSAGEVAGGYTVPASTSYPINFMIIHPSAVLQVVKHVVPRIFSPQVNQSADAWKFDYRIYHDCFVENNKVAGIYLHRAATANT